MEILLIIVIGIGISLLFSTSSQKKGKTFRKSLIINQNKIFEYLEQNNLRNNRTFLSRDYSSGIVFDEDKKQILLITKKTPNEYNFKKYPLSSVLQSEILIDNNTKYKTVRSSQILGTVVGGAVAGAVGMAIGGLSADKIKQEAIKSIDLKILVDDPFYPSYKINFLSNVDPITGNIIKDGYFKNSSEVKAAVMNIEKCYGIIEIAIRKQNRAMQS